MIRMKRTFLALGVFGLAAAVAGGCPRPPGDNDNNNNDNTGNNNELTAAQKATINAAVQKIEATAKVFATFSILVDNDFDFDDPQDDVFGDCPEVTITTDDDSITIQLDYGDGCRNDLTGQKEAAGKVQITLDRDDQSATFRFETFRFDGDGITGTLTVDVQRITAGGLELDGQMDVRVGDVRMVGRLRIVLAANGLISVDATSLRIVDDEDDFAFAFAVVVFDPQNNGSFIPEAGSVQFSVNDLDGNSTALLLVFTTDTPRNGTVRVTIDGTLIGEYQVPNLVD